MSTNTRSLPRALVSAIALLASPMALLGQDCEEGRELRPWLGIHRFHCPGGVCKVLGAIARTSNVARVTVERRVRSPYRYDFSVEPSLWGIHPDGPAADKLQDGDVLVAVNGRAVTTVQASEQLEALRAGDPVRLSVRRGSRLVEVNVTPTLSCERVWLSAGVTTDVALADEARRAAVEAVRVAAGLRRGPGLLGVAIRCGDCVLILSEVGGSQFRFDEYPEVVEVVEGSLAARAGLRPGDLMTHVDGKDLRTEEGADRLAKLVLRPGERVEIRYVRDGEARTGVATFDPEGDR